jgi:D-alanine-D-alanine ligase
MSRHGKVAVLMGGPSAEREVSLKSGSAVLAALQRSGVDAHGIDAGRDVLQQLTDGRFDRAFIALHGRWGEDGIIQGALEVLGLPYTGSGVLGSALGMDKLRCKQLWQTLGIPTPDYVALTSADNGSTAATRLGLPLFVKPNREGSSLGVTRVDDAAALAAAIAEAARLDDSVLVEQCIAGTELTAAVMGEQVWPLIALQTPHAFYDYAAKYSSDSTRYLCPCGLPADEEQRLAALSLRAFTAIGASGWGRVDFMLAADGTPYFLEINTVPGMTDHSLVPMAARQAGVEFDQLVMAILETSHDRRG